jgi:enamine deaminase RidA (YjgF/YER057c/UK114 family)
MSHLKYYNYPGVGEDNRANFNYSQAVRVGDQVILSGQGKKHQMNNHSRDDVKLQNSKYYIYLGGWHPDGKVASIPTEINAQIDQAFKNVDLALKTAGGKGWSQVFQVRSYHVPINGEAIAAMVRNFKIWVPDHAPLWTCVGVPRLGEDDMRVEIEVVAHDPEGAKVASSGAV